MLPTVFKQKTELFFFIDGKKKVIILESKNLNEESELIFLLLGKLAYLADISLGSQQLQAKTPPSFLNAAKMNPAGEIRKCSLGLRLRKDSEFIYACFTSLI